LRKFQKFQADFLGLSGRDLCIIVFLYTLMHGGLLLLPHAVFWDDWTLYREKPAVVVDSFRQAGAIFGWTGYLHVWLLGVGVWVYRVMTFVLYLLSGFLFNAILKRMSFFSYDIRFISLIFFLTLPFNMARVALIDFPYALCYFSFFLGWWFLGKNRLVALVCFLFSFNTNSLLVFYALPFLEFMYRKGCLVFPKKWPNFLLRNFDFVLAPFLYFSAKLFFFPPYGHYESYNNHYSFRNLTHSFAAQVRDVFNFSVNVYVFLILLAILWVVLRERLKAVNKIESQDAKKIIYIGVAAVLLGLIPYWVIRLTPTFFEWTSRHQLLMPLGTAMLLTGGLGRMRNAYIRRILLVVVIAASLSFGIEGYYSFVVDWGKQQSIMRQFAKNEEIRKADLVIIDDRSMDLNAIGRVYRFYEWNGILENSYGNQTRFSVIPGDLGKYKSGGFDQYFDAGYKAENHHRKKNMKAVAVLIQKSGRDSSGMYVFNQILPGVVVTTHPVDVNDVN